MVSTTLLGAGQSFAATTDTSADPASTVTDVKASLTLPDNGGDNPNPPSPVDPDNPGNRPNNPSGTFGIAYQPSIFNFESHALNDSGYQDFTAILPSTGDHAFHVGVKDKTRATKGWVLTASLTGDIADIPGVTMSLGNGDGAVKENTSEGLVNAPTAAVSGESLIDLTKVGGATKVMSGQDGFMHNSTYDYQLGIPTLKIADTKTVAAKDYTGNVNWDLSVATS